MKVVNRSQMRKTVNHIQVRKIGKFLGMLSPKLLMELAAQCEFEVQERGFNDQGDLHAALVKAILTFILNNPDRTLTLRRKAKPQSLILEQGKHYYLGGINSSIFKGKKYYFGGDESFLFDLPDVPDRISVNVNIDTRGSISTYICQPIEIELNLQDLVIVLLPFLNLR